MSWIDKRLEKIRQWKKELAEQYKISESAVIWKGGNKFIVVKDGKEIEI